MAKEQIGLIKSAGVVGAGGAGFPSYIKYDARVDTLIVNAAECEPLIDVDKLLISNYFQKVYEGIKTAADLLEVKKIYIALKTKYDKEIEVLENYKSNANGAGFEIFKMDNFYPAGDEQVLVYEITGRIVPEGGIPLMVGVVVTNVETLLNTANAISGKPVISKFVTVNGEVERPQTLEVPVGTPVSLLLDYCGINNSINFRVLDGGPMMGKLIDEKSYAVKKTTKSIIVLPYDSIVIAQKLRSQHSQAKRAQAICLSCRMCTDLCPRYLLGHYLFPDELMKKLYKGSITDEDLERFDFSYLCCDCGLCELYSCPVDLSPRSLLNYIKEKLAEKNIKNPHTRKDLSTNEFREYRRVPISRLVRRLEIHQYSKKTELLNFEGNVDYIKLYLSQHIGAKSIPVVKAGDKVSAGNVVANIPEGKIGSVIHSSISGTVAEINNDYIIVKK